MKTEKLYEKDLLSIITYLKEGKVVALPTDTVYGLAVIYENEQALKRLKEAKGRPENKPIPTMVSSIAQMEEVAKLNTVAKQLAKSFMPGAFTMVLKKQDAVASYLTNGLDTIGVRIPDDPFLQKVIQGCGKPLLVSSANLSGLPCGYDTECVLEQLDGRIDAIVVGEAKGKASTIVDLTGEKWKVLREGPISLEMIEKALHKEDIL
ncbi:MAG: threonylcarbamoyl-AMP synthase [Erysipelotrichaceae bacterium]|nr:threonylcarbamoyl-AMP synthase [Erysipelotrichaceae bacterium]